MSWDFIQLLVLFYTSLWSVVCVWAFLKARRFYLINLIFIIMRYSSVNTDRLAWLLLRYSNGIAAMLWYKVQIPCMWNTLRANPNNRSNAFTPSTSDWYWNRVINHVKVIEYEPRGGDRLLRGHTWVITRARACVHGCYHESSDWAALSVCLFAVARRTTSFIHYRLGNFVFRISLPEKMEVLSQQIIIVQVFTA